MSFPLTHLCVAQKVLFFLNEKNEKNISQFLLGSIAPDAIHYREEFLGAQMKNIGAAKKITHLCPVSEEKWGQVTDNDGWVECVKNFLNEKNFEKNNFCEEDSQEKKFFALGYAAHVLTDISNNKTLWKNFREKFPAEAAKGYASDYYADLRNIDTRLYKNFPGITEILRALEKSVPEEIDGLVSADEVLAIKNNLLYEHYKKISVQRENFPATEKYFFVSYDETIEFIENSATWISEVLA
ncbi:MAG: zinc dependent phospholipase C family protein [Defluviitaleaceae bacterium]|nr:zinc dependent phospholipase C family protein [Defluviitaleaceae bacterium]